jgi:hypothetical protein
MPARPIIFSLLSSLCVFSPKKGDEVVKESGHALPPKPKYRLELNMNWSFNRAKP